MFFLRMCTYLYLYLYLYRYLYLYDDETYLRPTGNSLIYSGRGASGDRTRRGPLCQRVGQVTPPKTGKAWMAWIHLDPSGSIVHLGLKVGEPWEINGKSMGNQWEINGKSLWKSPKWSGELWRAIVTIVLDGHQWRNHLLSLDRRNFLAARYDASRRVGVELPWHPMEDRELEPAEAGFQGASWGHRQKGMNPWDP